MLVRMQKNLISHTLSVGLYKGTATLKDSLAISLKMKHTYLMTHQSYFWEFIPEKWKLMPTHTQKTVYVNIHSAFICNKDYRYGNKPYDGSMAKQTVIPPNYGRLLNNKKNNLQTSLDGIKRNFVWKKKSEKATCYRIPFI